MINALDYGFVKDDDQFNNTPIFNQFLAETHGELYFPKGHYYFLTQPQQISRNIIIRGNGLGHTYLCRKYEGIDFEALINFQVSGKLQDLAIMADASTNGQAVRIIGTPASATVIENVWISNFNNGNFKYGIVCWASDQNQLGLRDFRLDEVHILSCTDTSLWMRYCQQANLNVNAYQAGGSADDVDIANCDNIQLRGCHIGGDIKLSNNRNVIVAVATYSNIINSNNDNLRII